MKYKLFTLSFFIISIAFSQDGVLDTSFGNLGTTVLSVPNKSARGKSMALLDDNSIIVGVNSEINYYGDIRNKGFYIYKLFPNGNIDTSFGNNGYIYFANQDRRRTLLGSITKLDHNEFVINCMILEENKIIKMDASGNIIFSSSVPFGFVIYYRKIGIQSDGKIIVPGKYDDGYHYLYALARFNTDGTIDTSFGNNGVVIIDMTNNRFDVSRAVAIQNDDKIVLVGKSYTQGADLHAVISRFNANGSIDTSFGNNGITVTQLLTNSNIGEFNDVGINSDGTIIVGANAYYSGGTGGFLGITPTIVKFDTNGFLDHSFGNQGIVNLNAIYGANDYLRTIYIQPDNKIIMGGGASNPFPSVQTDFYLARFNENGTIDNNFGNNGLFLTNFNNSEYNYVNDLEVYDNYILAFGCSRTDDNQFKTGIACRLTNESLSVSNYSVEVSLYPNPANDKIYLSNISSNFKSVNIFDLQGKLVSRQNIKDKNFVLVNNLASGIYLLKLRNQTETIVKKIIVEH